MQIPGPVSSSQEPEFNFWWLSAFHFPVIQLITSNLSSLGKKFYNSSHTHKEETKQQKSSEKLRKACEHL